MSLQRSNDYHPGLVRELCNLPAETELVEFKRNNSNPQEIGEYISALANSAAFEGKAHAYMTWGIENSSHKVVGTTFNPQSMKKGNEELENWLLQSLDPKIDFDFSNVSLDGHTVVLLEIQRASRRPVSFQGVEYIRIGSYKKKLRDFPEKERQLWRIFDQTPFEEGVAAEHLDADEVIQLLDYSSYFDLSKVPLPESRDRILSALDSERLIRPCEAGGWNVTNMGAMLFAKSLNDFPNLRRKAMRVVQYQGVGRTETLKEQGGTKGYASGFEGLLVMYRGCYRVTRLSPRGCVGMYPCFLNWLSASSLQMR